MVFGGPVHPKPAARRLEGVWTLVHKRQDKKYSRIFLEQNNFVFAVTAYPKERQYILFRRLKLANYVRVSGWLLEKAVLKSIRRCTWVAKNPNQYSEDNLQNNCSAPYSTDNRSSDAAYVYKRL